MIIPLTILNPIKLWRHRYTRETEPCRLMRLAPKAGPDPAGFKDPDLGRGLRKILTESGPAPVTSI